jgi:hypothetical protein
MNKIFIFFLIIISCEYTYAQENKFDLRFGYTHKYELANYKKDFETNPKYEQKFMLQRAHGFFVGPSMSLNEKSGLHLHFSYDFYKKTKLEKEIDNVTAIYISKPRAWYSYLGFNMGINNKTKGTLRFLGITADIGMYNTIERYFINNDLLNTNNANSFYFNAGIWTNLGAFTYTRIGKGNYISYRFGLRYKSIKNIWSKEE